jgi:hypothetical protein
MEIRLCPWTRRPIRRHPNAARYPNSYRYVDTGKACPWRVAYAAGFEPIKTVALTALTNTIGIRRSPDVLTLRTAEPDAIEGVWDGDAEILRET